MGGVHAVKRLECAGLTARPALAAAYDGDWIIRLAEGHTKRANSVTCLNPNDDARLEPRVGRMEAWFARHRLPPVFRLTPLAPPALDALLEERGWHRFDDSLVLMARLRDVPLTDTPALEPRPNAEDEWLDAFAELGGVLHERRAVLARMLRAIVPEAGFFVLLDGARRPAATAMAVLDGQLVGIFEVLSDPARRRQGFGRMVVAAALAWGLRRGAESAWLQVQADNEAATALYRSLGFTEVYRYHYRRPWIAVPRADAAKKLGLDARLGRSFDPGDAALEPRR